ncbi:MAG: hypothetical protein C4339_00040 [Nitrososphaerota archaeon]
MAKNPPPRALEAGPLLSLIIVASIVGLAFYQLAYLPALPKQANPCEKYPVICSPPGFVRVKIPVDAGVPNAPLPERYIPSTIVVVLGVNNTIIWTNDDIVVHTVTSDDGKFDSGLLNPGQSWNYTFTTPGTYPYHCIPHPFMRATVVVLAGNFTI